MCKVIEEIRREEREETLIDVAKRMLTDGILDPDKIAEYAGLSLDDVKALQT